MKQKLLLISLMLVTLVPAQILSPIFFGRGNKCCTFYVSQSTGNDANPGTRAQPWQTISKVNGTTFTPGQSVGFKRGDTWREQLTPGQSGTAGAPIMFAAYGVGANPLINAADIYSSWTSESGSTTAYVTLDANTKYLSTPATAANRLTGTTFRLEVDCQLVAYDFAGMQVLVAKDDANGANNARHWIFYMNFGAINLDLYDGSNNPPVHTFTVVTGAGLTNGVRYHLRADIVPNDGAGHSTVAFYKSPDGITYTQLGSTQTFASTITVNATNNTAVTVGRDTFIGTGPANGKFYRAQAWTGLGITPVFDGYLNDYISGTTWVAATTGETWTIQGGAIVSGNALIYYSVASPAPLVAFYDNILLSVVSSKVALVTGTWWWDSVNGRAYIFDNPTGHVVELSKRDYSVELTTKTNITLDSLYAKGGNAWMIHSTGDGFILRNSIAYGAGIDCVFFGGNGANIAGNVVSYCNANGIASTSNSTNATISNNDVSHVGLTTQDRSGISIFSAGTFGNVVRYNSVHDNSNPNAPGVRGIILDTVGSGFNSAIYNTVWNNNGGGIVVFGSQGQLVAYNAVWDGAMTDPTLQDTIFSNNNAPAMDGNLFYNNTVWTSKLIACYETNNSGGNIFKNNICYLTNSSGVGFFTQNGFAATQTWDYNLVYTTNATNLYTWNGNNYTTAAAFFAGTSQGQHDINSNPLFTNALAGNFTLQVGSPAIGAGIFLPGVNTANPPNMGAK